ncbi:hypothetical protein J7L24_00235 [bacterium]|nr:hypothetical protein [bacterium]
MKKKFLEQKYPDLEKSPEVNSAVRRQEKRQGERVKRNKRIEAYLHRLEEIFQVPDERIRERRINILKDKLYDLFIINPDNIPESHFELQKRIAREQGHGDIEISEELREQETNIIIKDQKQSIDTWIDYLGSKDAMYPAWLKYFTFRNIVRLGEYDKKKKEFRKRSKTTTGLFPDINREALAYVLDALQKQYGKEILDEKENIKDQEWEKLLSGANFSKLYAYAIENITPATQEQKESTKGEWVKYDQKSDPIPLYTSLQGHGTGWCTAGESTAKAQLDAGDFYVYYSENQEGKNIIPRVAIRMQGNQIAEVRGINEQQNLEPEMIDITENKMETLPGAKDYRKKSSDMRILTEIDNKVKQKEELNKKDLKFLYETESLIQGFGHQKDPRIKEILGERDMKEDLSFVFNCSKEQIGTKKGDVLKGKDIKFYYGNLYLSGLTSAEGLKLPENIGGSLYLSGLTSAEGLKLPENIGGYLDLSGLTSAEGLKLPENIRGDLDLSGLTSAEKERLGIEYPNLSIF